MLIDQVGENASGALWNTTMFDSKNDVTTLIGSMFFVDAPFGLDPAVCR